MLVICWLLLTHPLLSVAPAGRVWVNQGEIAGNGIDDDGNGGPGCSAAAPAAGGKGSNDHGFGNQNIYVFF